MIYVWVGRDQSKFQSYNILGVFLMNNVQTLRSERKFSSVIISLVNARGLRLERARVLREALLVLVLLNLSETMIWRENERLGIIAVQMNNIRGLFGIRRMDRLLNARIRELCTVGWREVWMKGLMKVLSVGLAILKE